MSTATADFELRPKLEAFEAAMRKIPGITAEEAKKAAVAWEQNFHKQQALKLSGLADLTKQTGDNIGKTWADLGKKITTTAGGPVAQLGDALFELVPKASAAGVAIGSIAAGAVGIAAVAGAVVGLGEAADAAEHRLLKAGLASMIPQEARDSVNDYDKATKRLGNATDVLIATYGSGLLPVLTEAANKTTTLITVADRLHESFQHVGDSVHFVASAATLGVLPAFEKVKEVATGIHDAFLDFIGDSDKVTEWLHSMGISAKQGAGAWLIQAGTISEVEKSYKGLSETALDYMQEQAAIDDDERAAQDKLADAIIKKHKEEAKARAAAAAAAKRDALAQEKEQLRFGEAVAAARTKERDDEAHAAYARSQEAKQEHQDEVQALKDQESFAAAVKASREAEKEEAAKAAYALSQQKKEQQALDLAKLQGITDVIDATQQLADLMAQGTGKGARKAFRVSQALAEAQIAMSTAKSVAEALTTPWLIPGIIALGGVEAAKVASQKPPEMPGGGVVPFDMSADHRLVPVQPGEGVVSRRGMADLGEDGLRELNRGRGGGIGPITIIHQYTHRAFNAVVTDNLKTDSPLARAVASQRKPGHSRRV